MLNVQYTIKNIDEITWPDTSDKSYSIVVCTNLLKSVKSLVLNKEYAGDNITNYESNLIELNQ